MTKQATHGNRFWGAMPLPKSKTDFFDAVTAPGPTGGSIATIRMYGPIDSWGGFWGISTKDVGQVLDGLGDEVTQIILRINSPGGEVHEGMAILNMLRAHKASVTAVVDGLAGSAASFIAAGVDETVMSPGTNMVIHSPWGFAIGNATELRKSAEILDTLEASIVEIYAAKAGAKDWATLLAEETWMTAVETVAFGLADRVAVVPDAGETATVADEDVVIVMDPDGDAEDSISRLARVAAAYRGAPKPPDSSEPVESNRKEDVVAYDDLTAGLRDRLGLSDADASDETLLAALDSALEDLTNPTTAPIVPEGTVLMDAAAVADLRSAAEDGRIARAEQDRQRRDAIVANAVTEGRIAPASRDSWRAQLDTNEEGTSALLSTLAPNTIPVAELGHAPAEASADDAAYYALFPDERPITKGA